MADYWMNGPQGRVARPDTALLGRHLDEIGAGIPAISQAPLDAAATAVPSGPLSLVMQAYMARLSRTGGVPPSPESADDPLMRTLAGLLGDGPEVAALRVARNARAAGIVAEEGMVTSAQHHVFPQERAYAKWFGERDVDIHEYCVSLAESEHQAQHGGGDSTLARGEWEHEWNAEIMRRLFAREHEKRLLLGDDTKLSRDEILEVARELMAQRGIPERFERYRRAPGRADGAGER